MSNKQGLTVWDPWSEWLDFPALGRASESWVNRIWSAPWDVVEDADHYRVTVELPGCDQKEISVSLEEGVLQVEAQKEAREETQNAQIHRRERAFGRFSRALELPKSIDASKIRATYRNGVLEIEIPKLEDAKPRSIRIEVKK